MLRYLKTIKMLITRAAALSYRVITQQHVVLRCNFVKFLFLLKRYALSFHVLGVTPATALRAHNVELSWLINALW
jgi:hypothetical protein